MQVKNIKIKYIFLKKIDIEKHSSGPANAKKTTLS